MASSCLFACLADVRPISSGRCGSRRALRRPAYASLTPAPQHHLPSAPLPTPSVVGTHNATPAVYLATLLCTNPCNLTNYYSPTRSASPATPRQPPCQPPAILRSRAPQLNQSPLALLSLRPEKLLQLLLPVLAPGGLVLDDGEGVDLAQLSRLGLNFGSGLW